MDTTLVYKYHSRHGPLEEACFARYWYDYGYDLTENQATEAKKLTGI